MGIWSFISGIIGNLVPNSCAGPWTLVSWWCFLGREHPLSSNFLGNKCLQTMLEDELILMGDNDRFAPRCREVWSMKYMKSIATRCINSSKMIELWKWWIYKDVQDKFQKKMISKYDGMWTLTLFLNDLKWRSTLIGLKRKVPRELDATQFLDKRVPTL